MITDTNKNTAPGLLGGEKDIFSLADMLPAKIPPKKHSKEVYLRSKVINGRRYWYACRSVKVKGQWREKSVYIGSAAAILELKQKAGPGTC